MEACFLSIVLSLSKLIVSLFQSFDISPAIGNLKSSSPLFTLSC